MREKNSITLGYYPKIVNKGGY